jgi:transcriptional regulator with XRE-family HTH domain
MGMTGSDCDSLARLRKAAGYTQETFVAAFIKEATRLGVSASVSVRQLRRWESENPPPLPHPNQQLVLEAVFGIPLNEMGFTVPSHRRALAERIGDDGEVKRRTFVTGSGVIAAASILPDKRGPRIGASEAAALRSRLDNLYTVDHASGGIPAKARAEQMEQQLTQLLADGVYTGRIGRDLQTILCEIGCHRAWFGYDSGPLAEARAACMEAMTAAQLVDNPLLQVRALNTLSLLSVDAGRSWEAASAVENAYSLANRAGAGPTVHLVIALREAHAATSAGDLTGARRALSRAMSHQARTDTDTEVPQWARFAGPVEVDYATAAYYAQERRPARAVSFLRAAVAGLGGGYARNTAWYRARLAQTLLDMNEAEEACHEMTGVLNGCGNVSSARLDRRLRAFEQSARTFDNPATREMADLIRETRASAA